MIIDCHCHAGLGDKLTDPWNTSARLGVYLRRADAAGIQRSVIFGLLQTDTARANAQVAELVRRRPERFIGFAFIHPELDRPRMRATIAQAVAQWGFRGIKVHGSDALPNRRLCELAAERRLPMLIDVVGKAAVIDMVAPEFPELNLIVAHLGSFVGDWRAHQLVIDQLVRYPNVYADTAGVQRFDYLLRAVRLAGARKLLFGSDGPWLHPGLELEKIRLLKLPPEQEALITGGNLLRLIGAAGSEPAAKKLAVNLPAPLLPASPVQPARRARRARRATRTTIRRSHEPV